MDLKLQRACETLKKGGLLVYPTEAVYGLGCLASDEQALRRLRRLKHRPPEKGLIVLCSSLAQVKALLPVIKLNSQHEKRLQAKQAHPTTWLIPFTKGFAPLLTGSNPSLAVRISSHPEVKALCDNCGPIVSTSANFPGQATPDTLLKVRKVFGARVDYYLDAPLGKAGSPSQIIDLLSGEIVRSA